MVGSNNRNPYIIGRPIKNNEQIFGRESLFGFIDDNLSKNVKVILLHGQRRIGKSSVLHQIPNFVGNDEFVFVRFDLQDKSQLTLSSILHDLAREIVDHLELEGIVQPPNLAALEADTDIFAREFLPSVYQAISDRNLVLLLDEFDVAENQKNIINKGDDFFEYLRLLTSNQERLFIIPVVGRHVGELTNLLSLFRGAPYLEIGFLDDISANRLIRNPAQGILTYEPEAIKAIQELSAGHPYFTQIICSCLFGRAREKDNWTVTRANVESIVDQAIESAEAGLAWFWDGLSIEEKAIFSAVAEAQKIAIEQNQIVPEEPLKLLKRYGVIQTKSLEEAVQQLERKRWLDDTKRRVRVELVRRWLVQRHPLKGEINNELKALKSQTSDVALLFQSNRFLIGAIAAVLAATALGLGGYRAATPCSAGQEKILGIICANGSNISRGDRTLFPITGNPNRDRGIAAFKQGNYSQAAQFFERAVKDNRNDPEVLIYYNNAIAKQKGSPVTLAVVVPADNGEPTAKEILRGVAQAQNQFNTKGGLNGRLLEIVIANDADNKEQAKQVAAELVKDKSVLGVIGHYSSDATKPALAEYKQTELAIISPTSTGTSLQGSNFFRTVASDAAAGKHLAEYARKTLNLNAVAIFYNPDSPYSDSLREEFTKNFERLGGSVLRKIDLTEPKFNPETEVANSLDKDKVQAVMLFPDSQNTDVALKIARANTQQTAKLKTSPQNPQRQGLKLLGGDALYSQTTLNKGGQDIEGLILDVPWFREAAQSQNFAQKAAQQWEGEISWRTATSFDATQALIKALSPNPTRATVLRGLKNINLSASETSGYPLRFTSEGERQSNPNIVMVKGGKFTLPQ